MKSILKCKFTSLSPYNCSKKPFLILASIYSAPHYFNTQGPSIQEYNWWYRGTDDTPKGLTHGGYVDIGQNLTADFHTYRVEWKYDSITWLTDGKVIHTVNKADTWDGTKYVFPSEPSRIELGIWDAGYANS